MLFNLLASIILTLISTGNERQETPVKIVFYNVENLFDTIDDPSTTDEDFTPAGNYHWTYKRYNEKLDNLSKVIIAIGGWNPPDIIGLCEVENSKVLLDLTCQTPLARFNYKFIHEDSPDRRGIDVALLYRSESARLLRSRYLTVDTVITRDILYARFLMGRDTCHIFVNHWPSRSSGQLETDKGRFAAARLLKAVTDSILAKNVYSRIVIMGDFNDEPDDESIQSVLQAQTPGLPIHMGRLYNLSVIAFNGPAYGTLKYQGNWNVFDQVIVSGSLLSNQSGLTTNKNGYSVFDNPFLLEPDETYNGFKPRRTYTGYKYTGGFSDHLPVILELNRSPH